MARPVEALVDGNASDLHASLGERLGAQAGEAFMGGVRTITRIGEYSAAEGNVPDFGGPISPELGAMFDPAKVPTLSLDDAKARIKQEGLETHVKLPDQPTIKQPVLDLMIAHGQERRQYEAAVSRGPQGFLPDALGFITEMGVGMIDPVNLAAFSIPVVGEARYGMMLAGAGESLAARAGVKAGVGAAQGAVGSTALVPGDWWLHTRDGQDYTMADALRSVVMGAGMGAGFHAGLGAIGDVRARTRGAPLEGSPGDILLRSIATHEEIPPGPGQVPPPTEITHPRTPLGEIASPGEAVPGIELPPEHPAQVLADLPPRVREDVARGSIADVINDRPVRAAELLQEAAKQDPRIAESVDRSRGEAPADRGPMSLLEFIAASGGVSSKDPLASDFHQAVGGQKSVRGYGKLVSPEGRPLDRMREAAVEAGYLRDPGAEGDGLSTTTIRDLIDAADAEARGQKHYPEGEEPVLSARQRKEIELQSDDERRAFRDMAGQDVDRLLDEHGVTAVRPQLRQRALAILESEGGDVRPAVERALDEFDMAGNRSRVGDSDVADWEQFRGPRPDDAELVAASKEAAAAPEPASIEPAKAVTAAERSAAEAEQLLHDLMPRLSEAERADFEEALAKLDRESSERVDMVEQGAACLAAAVG